VAELAHTQTVVGHTLSGRHVMSFRKGGDDEREG